MDRSVNYFYTSCTRSDGWPSISRFHADLEYRLRAQEGLWVSGVLGPQTGSGPVLESTITQVGVMLALYSREYFADQNCGLEWAVFQRRMRRHSELSNSDVSECLVPIVWEPVPRDLRPRDTPDPEWPCGAEWDDGHGIRQYDSQGLSGLMRSDSPEANETYFSLIGELAKRIAEAQRCGLTVIESAELRDTQPAFGYKSHARQATPTRKPVAAGPGPIGRDTTARTPCPAVPSVPVAISYVGADQPWADWMEEVLEQGGHYEVRQVRWETERESLAETVQRARLLAGRVVVVFSRSYFTAGATQLLDWETVFVGPGKEWLIPVQIDQGARPLLVRSGVPVTLLNGSDEREAQRLRELVREPGPPVPGQREGDTP
ncbi:TIR domain-containing protein [Streptomyces sp. NBC_00986]|uniref:TIR domain-containing protein n=1 Tax=Streptomyces sp. NBC_00986 TaxID=2903702 RepID=UPI00386C1256|nr:toll/interleukin-1 receptor domain-containing protein [Streptomyces sp. NBC_00986]